MSGFTCFNLQERLMPVVRAQAARRLASQGLRQARIAAHLGVSQAMVSKYLRSQPKPPRGISPAAVQSIVDRAVASALEQEQRGRLPAWCPLCPEFDKQPMASVMDECLRGEDATHQDDASVVLEDVRRAAERLRRGGFGRLAPQVGVNVAMATRDARDARGVAAVPGRFAQVRGGLQPVGEPEFGASHHLSDVLLRAQKQAPHVRATLCVRDGEDVREALKAAGFSTHLLGRKANQLVITVPRAHVPDALVDPGSFGIEPITYILGSSATAAVDKAERLLDLLPRMEKP